MRTDPVDERRPWWWVRIPIGPLVLAYLLILGVAWYGFDQSHEADRERCRDAAAGRLVLRELVMLTDDDGVRSGAGLTRVPGFDALEPNMQEYLTNLDAALSDDSSDGSGESSEFVRRALELLPPIDCSEVP